VAAVNASKPGRTFYQQRVEPVFLFRRAQRFRFADLVDLTLREKKKRRGGGGFPEAAFSSMAGTLRFEWCFGLSFVKVLRREYWARKSGGPRVKIEHRNKAGPQRRDHPKQFCFAKRRVAFECGGSPTRFAHVFQKRQADETNFPSFFS